MLRTVCTTHQLETILGIFIFIYLRNDIQKSSGAKIKITGIEQMLRFHRNLNSVRGIQNPAS